jgi:hypothetical protein
MRVELLIDPGKMAMRGQRMLHAMVNAAPAAGVKVEPRFQYRGDCDVLMTYGTGHPVRRPWWQKHRAAGGRCVGWDLGYWLHDTGTMRCTIDDDHPWRLIREEEPTRWERDGIELQELRRNCGPVILVGVTAKACRAHGYEAGAWERNKLRQIQRRWPGREVIFRPKRDHDPNVGRVPHVRTVTGGSIFDLLKGASLVVARHSNVAVDACIAGVPAVVEDGAARALFTGGMDNPTVPTREQRLQFLRSLAHWQYRPDEAALAWSYILNRLRSG